MDKNKLDKLHDINYKIHKSCGLCQHANFKSHNNYGTCNLHNYKHLKHTGKERELSINKFGGCSSFKLCVDLTTWTEFLK